MTISHIVNVFIKTPHLFPSAEKIYLYLEAIIIIKAVYFFIKIFLVNYLP